MSHNLELKKFAAVNLQDPFFNTLKDDYIEFEEWFNKKSDNNALVSYENGGVTAFLYVKIETEELTDIQPALPAGKRLKIGTFKINAHGTRLGERYLKRIFDIAISQGIEQIYVTVFPKHEGLVSLFEKFGFIHHGSKTTHNGTERVYTKNFKGIIKNVSKDYPCVLLRDKNKYLLSIYPQYHTRLFPDSKLQTENYDVLRDVSHTNSIYKIYISWMKDIALLKSNDVILIYRTKDEESAWYTSVVTSICTVEEIKTKSSFKSYEEYLKYCKDYSVFTEDELKKFYQRDHFFVIKMLYNVAFPKRLNRKKLVEEVGLDQDAYWGIMKISDTEFEQIIQNSLANPNYFIK